MKLVAGSKLLKLEVKRLEKIEQKLSKCDKHRNANEWKGLNTTLAKSYEALGIIEKNSSGTPEQQNFMDKSIYYLKQIQTTLDSTDHMLITSMHGELNKLYSQYPCSDIEMQSRYEELEIEGCMKALEALDKEIERTRNEPLNKRVEAWAFAASICSNLTQLYQFRIKNNTRLKTENTLTRKENIKIGNTENEHIIATGNIENEDICAGNFENEDKIVDANKKLAIAMALKGFTYGSADVRAQWPQHFDRTAAETHEMLSCIYATINSGGVAQQRAANQEQAIVHGKLAAKGIDMRTQEWITLQLRLGVVLAEREGGDLRINLELSLIALRKGMQMLQEVGNGSHQAEIMGLTYLGHVYRWRLAGDRSMNLETSIKSYEQVLIYASSDHGTKEDVYQVVSGLSKAWEQRMQGTRDENLTEAVTVLHRFEYFAKLATSTFQKCDGGDINRIREYGDLLRKIDGQLALMHLEQGLHRGGVNGGGDEDISEALDASRNQTCGNDWDWDGMCNTDRAEVMAIVAMTIRGGNGSIGTGRDREHSLYLLNLCEEDSLNDSQSVLSGSNLGNNNNDDNSDNEAKLQKAVLWTMYKAALKLYDTADVEESALARAGSNGTIISHTAAKVEKSRTGANGTIIRMRTRQERMEFDLTKNRFLVDYATMVFNEGHPDVDNIENSISLFERALEFWTKKTNPQRYGSIHMHLAMLYLQRVDGNLRDNVESSARSYDLCMELPDFEHKSFCEGWERDNMAIGANNRRIKADLGTNVEIDCEPNRNLKIDSRQTNLDPSTAS